MKSLTFKSSNEGASRVLNGDKGRHISELYHIQKDALKKLFKTPEPPGLERTCTLLFYGNAKNTDTVLNGKTDTPERNLWGKKMMPSFIQNRSEFT